MKKLYSILALVLTLVMLFSLAITAHATEYGTLTVNGAQIAGKTITAVRMFTASWVDDTTGLTVLGVALVIGGVLFTSRKKKETEDEA